MEVSQVRRLKELEEENRKFKQMYAELALDNQILLHVDIDRTVRVKARLPSTWPVRAETRKCLLYICSCFPFNPFRYRIEGSYLSLKLGLSFH